MARITLRVVPRSGRSSIERGDGALVVRVRAAPEKGLATRQALETLAKALGVPRTSVRLLSGARSRTKVVEVVGVSADELERRLAGL